MCKPLHYYKFSFIDGMWRDVAGNGGVLADVLSLWDLEIDYRTQFARIKDFGMGLEFTFRAYTCEKIELTITKLSCDYGDLLRAI